MASMNLDALRLPEQHLAEHNADPAGHQRGYIRGTDYSLPYTSQWSRLHAEEASSLLRHLNCSYLSTHGQPPTLLSLKQHAQALCNLILMLVPTVEAGEIDAANHPLASGASASDARAAQYRKNDAFDFLNDLRTPYTNDDPDHQLPLRSLVNEVRSRSDLRPGETEYHCALARAPTPRAAGQLARPYANHHNLLMHANACLERLDHEFSAEGGLMAVLPDDGEYEAADKAAARNSLLGQWLGFTQHLVRRAHELEIAYGNALDLVQGDSVLPMQVLSAAGPDGRSTGRQIAYPQDRWVLANAGDDTYAYIQKMLDAREAVDQEMERGWRDQGVSGERQWKASKHGQAAARGIVAVNLATRYYRLAGKGHGTLFVVPGWDGNPAVEYAKMLEKKPGVVGVPVAKWPERVTEIEKRVGALEKEEREREAGRTRDREEALRGLAERETMSRELERLRGEVEVLEQYMGEGSRDFAGAMANEREEVKRARMAMEMERKRHEKDVEELRRRNERLQAEVSQARRAWKKPAERRSSEAAS